MLDLRSTEHERSQYQEKVTRYKATLAAAGCGKLASGLTAENIPYLSIIEPGPAQSKVELPTTSEVLVAVARLEELTRSASDIRRRLEALGFTCEPLSKST